MWGEGTIVVAKSIEADEIMRKVPEGKLIAINNIREQLATKHGATIACPITTGIFARITAGAAEEDCKNKSSSLSRKVIQLFLRKRQISELRILKRNW